MAPPERPLPTKVIGLAVQVEVHTFDCEGAEGLSCGSGEIEGDVSRSGVSLRAQQGEFTGEVGAYGAIAVGDGGVDDEGLALGYSFKGGGGPCLIDR